jgi:hypothetical protein
VRIKEVIRELKAIKKKYGNVPVEAYADGATYHSKIKYIQATPDTFDFRGHSNEDGLEARVLIGDV